MKKLAHYKDTALKHIGVLHQNVQSIGNSVDGLQYLMEKNEECGFLCITEHWKTEQQLSCIGLQGFYLASSWCREENQHGGSAVYVRNGIDTKVRSDIVNLSVKFNFECAAIESKFQNRVVLIISIYRPCSGCLDLFFEKLEQLLMIIVDINTTVFIAGDFNIDLQQQSSSREKSALLSLMCSYGLTATFSDCTRVTATGGSCIDNIFTNCTEAEVLKTEIIHSMISDHTAQKIIFLIENTPEKLVFKRIFNECNKQCFLSELANTTWVSLYECNGSDVNHQWDVFMYIFGVIFNNCFPLKKINLRKNHNSTYNSREVIECKNLLDILYSMSIVDPAYKQQYNEVKRFYDQLLVVTRSRIYENKINQSENKSKCMWNIVNEIRGTKQTSKHIKIEGDVFNTVNEYNKYITTIASQLVSKLQNIPYVNRIPVNSKSMYFRPVTVEEIINIGGKLKNKYSCGEDDIPQSIVKYCIKAIADPVCFIVNNSLTNGIFPDKLKVALIKLLHKKGDPTLVENYRPISLLSVFSKIFERVMHSRVSNFFTTCGIFNSEQHGYLNNRSTITGIFDFIHKVTNSLEDKMLILGLFLDLTKAYDCLDYNILLSKLHQYGIRGVALDWFHSYLHGRRQRIVVDGAHEQVKSNFEQITMGIPQGSVLGPVLFVIYINDLADTVNSTGCTMVNYADDTNILASGLNFPDLVTAASRVLSSVSEWFTINKLILNNDKTGVVLFKTNHASFVTPDTLLLNNETYATKQAFKFLGIHVDDVLNWQIHIDYVCSKLQPVCYGVKVLKRYMNISTLKTVYHATFVSRARYGILFWGASSAIEKIFILQKRVLRNMLGLRFRESCRGKFVENNLLTVSGLYIIECLTFFFKYKHMFDDGTKQRNYYTRTLDYNFPRHRLNVTEKGAYYQCLKLYNRLPDRIKQIGSFAKYKTQITAMLIGLEPYSVGEYMSHTW